MVVFHEITGVALTLPNKFPRTDNSKNILRIATYFPSKFVPATGVTTRLCHGLAWILTVSQAALKLQDGSQWFPWWQSCCTITQTCLHRCVCIFAVSVVCTVVVNRCPGHQCMQVCTFHKCFWHHRTYLWHNHWQRLQVVHMRSCMRSWFIRIWGRGWGGSPSLWNTFQSWDPGQQSTHKQWHLWF